MKYINPDIESSYHKNDLGETLYELVLKYRPKKIVEFGTLHGYSTIAMAMALDELGKGHIYAYDLFDDYEFKHTTIKETQGNIDRYNMGSYITLIKKNYKEWLSSPEDFDLLHIDVSNKGDTIELVYGALKDRIENGAIVVFEGGSEERDSVPWMKKYKQKKLRETNVPFEVIDSRFPSLSIIKRENE